VHAVICAPTDCIFPHFHCRYLHDRFSQLQEEVNLLKSNIMKYKVETECLSERDCCKNCLETLRVLNKFGLLLFGAFIKPSRMSFIPLFSFYTGSPGEEEKLQHIWEIKQQSPYWSAIS